MPDNPRPDQSDSSAEPRNPGTPEPRNLGTPEPPTGQDDHLIGAERLPRKGDDEYED